MEKRIVNTRFGKFVIKGNIATNIADDNFHYHLPSDEMSDKEIQDYFNEELE